MIDMKLERAGEKGRYVAKENSVEVGSCDFLIQDDVLRIISADSDDSQVIDGLLRSSLFWGLNHGVLFALFDENMDIQSLVRTSFLDAKTGEKFGIAEFFSGGCKCT